MWSWTESTSRSRWWHSHTAGIYSDCSIRKIIITWSQIWASDLSTVYRFLMVTWSSLLTRSMAGVNTEITNNLTSKSQANKCVTIMHLIQQKPHNFSFYSDMTKDKLVVTSWDRTKVISIAKITIFAIEITLVQIYTLIHWVKKN